MKTALIALPLLLAIAAPAPLLASAQDDHSEHEKAQAKFTIETPIEKLMADEKARAVVLETLPDLDKSPYYGQIKGMSLKAVQPYSQGMITEEMLETISAGLAELD